MGEPFPINQGAIKTLSDLLLVIAAIASMSVSAFGFSAGVWGRFPGGTSVNGILDLLSWLLPTLSVFVFVCYLVSRSVGLKCAWAIAIGSTITSMCGLALGQLSMTSFLFPMIQLVACFAFYGDARLQNKIAQRLSAGNQTR